MPGHRFPFDDAVAAAGAEAFRYAVAFEDFTDDIQVWVVFYGPTGGEG